MQYMQYGEAGDVRLADSCGALTRRRGRTSFTFITYNVAGASVNSHWSLGRWPLATGHQSPVYRVSGSHKKSKTRLQASILDRRRKT